MGSIPSGVEEQAIQEERLSTAPPTLGAQDYYEKPTNTKGIAGVVLAVFALSLVFGVGFWSWRSVRRLELRMAHLGQQMDQLNRRVRGAEQHSQTLAQPAAHAAASARAAAQQRDQAKQTE